MKVVVIRAIFTLSGKKAEYLGVQKNQQASALCPLAQLPRICNHGRKKPVSREVAMEELLQVLVDDVEFSFPPERDSIVEYRSALRLRNFDFDANRKRIKALRLALEQKGWASADNF
ncbi:hypothetical protein CUMW_170430, partial [Citrus unshiu]